MYTQRAGRTINMQQLPSIPYLIYQSIIEFASLLPPCLLPDFDSHSLRRYPPPPLPSFCAAPLPFLSLSHSFPHDAASLIVSLACFRFSWQLPKNATKPLPLITAFIIFPFSSFYPPSTSPLLQMMHVLRGEYFHLNSLTVSNKEDGSASQEKGTG